MRQIILRWECNRCGRTVEQTTDATHDASWAPPEWRSVYRSNAAENTTPYFVAHLCAACQDELTKFIGGQTLFQSAPLGVGAS